MITDFDKPFDPEHTDSDKWLSCKNGEIPLWVAEMDFPVPSPLLLAMKERLEYPYFGYSDTDALAFDAIIGHYQKTYGQTLSRSWLMTATTVMSAVYGGCMSVGGTVMYCTPIYSHIRKVSQDTGLKAIEVPLAFENGRYTFDFEAMEAAVTPDVKSFILCNPHNPVGRVYTREELKALAQFCRRHGLTIVSDEIHCEILFEGRHVPAFEFCEEAGVPSITVASCAKICNMPMIPIAFTIIPDEEVRNRYRQVVHGLYGHGAVLNCIALGKAYDGSCDEYKAELLTYLKQNRNYVQERVTVIDGLSMIHNEATYLAWIDCRETGLTDPAGFFREKARVRMSAGEEFGESSYVRLNYACARSLLTEALDRIEAALSARTRQQEE